MNFTSNHMILMPNTSTTKKVSRLAITPIGAELPSKNGVNSSNLFISFSSWKELFWYIYVSSYSDHAGLVLWIGVELLRHHGVLMILLRLLLSIYPLLCH